MNCVCYLSEMGIRTGAMKSLGRTLEGTPRQTHCLCLLPWAANGDSYQQNGSACFMGKGCSNPVWIQKGDFSL